MNLPLSAMSLHTPSMISLLPSRPALPSLRKVYQRVMDSFGET
ncbi:hypothetical protein NC653_021173 [Populus alba x Populus x berolinensis]|uniref:Uncharacterized protein n=1 Tax=Populus alba x Populus x berolinensis TaxID=444605 RepID=A0AAD6QDA9_9ROSI|nr:hypothetical protein NC653_021173 [Populus alba x Populus x berolinensis]